jgi:hypothetical protein
MLLVLSLITVWIGPGCSKFYLADVAESAAKGIPLSYTSSYHHLNPILHTAWLDNHALTLKRNTAKYNFFEKSSYLHTFVENFCESRKI